MNCGLGHYVCHTCLNFFVVANTQPELQQHGNETVCTLQRGYLSVGTCYGCLFQRCLDIGVNVLLNQSSLLSSVAAPQDGSLAVQFDDAAGTSGANAIAAEATTGGRPRRRRVPRRRVDDDDEDDEDHTTDEMGVAEMLMGMKHKPEDTNGSRARGKGARSSKDMADSTSPAVTDSTGQPRAAPAARRASTGNTSARNTPRAGRGASRVLGADSPLPLADSPDNEAGSRPRRPSVARGSAHGP